MNTQQVEKAFEVFAENYNMGLSTKEEFKANVEGVIVLVNIVDPDNQDVIEFVKQSYRDVVNKY